MSNEGVVSEKDTGLLKGGVIVIAGGGDYELVEDRVGQDVDQKYFSLGNREVEEVDGDLVGGGVQDGGHVKGWGFVLRDAFLCLPAGVLLIVIGKFPHVFPIGGGVLQFPGNKGFPLPRDREPDT